MKHLIYLLFLFPFLCTNPFMNHANGASNTLSEGPKTWNIWSGNQSTNWTDPLNWSVGVPTVSSRVRISSSAVNFPVITSPASCLEIEIESGAILTISNSALIVAGQITNNGTITANTGTITMFGSGNGSISGSSIDVNRLVLNKVSIIDTIFLNTTVSVIDEAVFINGLIYSGNEEIVFLDESSTRDGSYKSFIEGTVRKIGNNDFTFPLGNLGMYAPISISPSGADTDEFVASYSHENPDSAGYNTSSFQSSLVNISSCEYWLLNREVGTANARVSLSYEDVHSCEVIEPWNLHVARWNGTQWIDHGANSYEGDTDEGTVESLDAISSFSPFTLGSTSFSNPLPVELLSFDAYLDGNNVKIKWSTATETNCDYFLVERSSDLDEFLPVGILPGAGNSTSIQNYEIYDEAPLSEVVYYRLKQFDYDGQLTTYPPESVHVNPGFNLQVYPNPARDNLNILQSGFGESVQVVLFNAAGKEILSKTFNQRHVELPTNLFSAGYYVVQVSGMNGVLREKLIVK